MKHDLKYALSPQEALLRCMGKSVDHGGLINLSEERLTPLWNADCATRLSDFLQDGSLTKGKVFDVLHNRNESPRPEGTRYHLFV